MDNCQKQKHGGYITIDSSLKDSSYQSNQFCDRCTEELWCEDCWLDFCLSNPEDAAWEAWLANAELMAYEDENSWPPLFVPQSKSTLLGMIPF